MFLLNLSIVLSLCVYMPEASNIGPYRCRKSLTSSSSLLSLSSSSSSSTTSLKCNNINENNENNENDENNENNYNNDNNEELSLRDRRKNKRNKNIEFRAVTDTNSNTIGMHLLSKADNEEASCYLTPFELQQERIVNQHIKFYGFDDLFPLSNLGKCFVISSN
jgi:hypothetical protein